MWDDIFDIRPTNKEMAALILSMFVFLVAAFSLGYMLGVERTRENLHDNGNGAAGVGEQIGQAGTDIQHAADGIKEAAGTADKIGAGIETAKESAQYIHSTADTSAELISECQSIIAGIRARGQAAKTKD
jgi:methyl-accepting chemotaxis protein